MFALCGIRVKFERGEEIKYISHLDIVKAFERALRRSGVPAAYTQGFNPHPQMVFGLPLPVGVTSEAEYADFELEKKMSSEEFARTLNSCLPRGLRIAGAGEKRTKRNIMASITMASYCALVFPSEGGRPSEDLRKICEFIGNFGGMPSIIVKKEGKNGPKNVDIKPMIHGLEAGIYRGRTPDNACAAENFRVWEAKAGFAVANAPGAGKYPGHVIRPPALMPSVGKMNRRTHGGQIPAAERDSGIIYVFALLSAGSRANLKPEALFEAFGAISAAKAAAAETGRLIIHRTGLYAEAGGMVVEPLSNAALTL